MREVGYSKNYEKICLTCESAFSGTSKQKWCREEKQKPCEKCGTLYSYTCGKEAGGRFCSVPCGKRWKPVKEKVCGCGTKFTRAGQGCLEEKNVPCEICSKLFGYVCKSTALRFCSTACQATHATHHPATVAARKDPENVARGQRAFERAMEAKYGPGITNPSQLESVKKQRSDYAKTNSHALKDGTRAKYGVDNISQVPEVARRMGNSNKISQRTPAVVAKRLKKTHPHLKHVEEFVELDYFSWAIQFEMDNGVLPTPLDLQTYFNAKSALRIPYKFKELFDLRDSTLELRFKALLDDLGFTIDKDYFRRKRFLRDSGDTYGKEIDFFFPEYMIGFEIQDFATHALAEGEVGMRGMTKNGPVYSQDKIRRAESYGISLYEVWEDEFKDIAKLEKDIMLTLMAKLLDSETVGNAAAHPENQRERRTLIETGAIKPIPSNLRPDPSDMKVWWSE